MNSNSLKAKPEILLIGAGGHATACIDVVEQQAEYNIVGLLGFREEVGKTIVGYRVLGADSDLPTFAKKYRHALIAIGQIKSPEIRIKIFYELERAGCSMPIIILPLAYVSPHAELHEGTIVMHGAIVNARAIVGKNCIVNSNTLIEHDVQVGDHCHIATSATLNGGAIVGNGSFIGSNSAVQQLVKIGERCVIGMGQIVRRDCPNDSVLPAIVKVP